MSNALLAPGLALAERGMIPTPLLRRAIRRLCRQRLTPMAAEVGVARFLADFDSAPIAVATAEANEQHYEVPSDFFELVLGRHLKYSSCLYGPGTESLDQAEEAMLALTCERAGIADGQTILELGCGWGSLSLWMARHYPNARIVAVSNSATQRAFIESHQVTNLEVRTADMNQFDPKQTFDRIVSVEMFEHMRNWKSLLGRVADWLAPGGRLFVHVFCHASMAYPFETEGDDNWMGRYFFTGGIMPSFDLLPQAAAGALQVEKAWWVDGTHYQRTAADWLANLDRCRADVILVLRAHYGAEAPRWFHRWRMFFLACEELFGYRDGKEWGVGHYRLALASE